jgi:hypothetical protein
MIHFYLRCSYYKIKIILIKNCKNEVIRVYTSLSESSRIYTSMSRLIFEHIIVFTNGLFIIQTETESSRAEFTSGRAHLTPLRTLIERFHGLSFEEHRRGMCICKYGERETPIEKEKREIKENNKNKMV